LREKRNTAIFCNLVEIVMPADVAYDNLDESGLQVYLLGPVDFDTLQRFQRWLHFEISGNRSRAALIVCEHSPLITIGRQGSRSHVRLETEELRLRGWAIRWVNRGGGCILHTPGQIALYPILPLDRLGLTIPDYLRRLNVVIARLLEDFNINGEATDAGVRVGQRLLSINGVSVHDQVTTYGTYLNVQPPLGLYRNAMATDQAALTSLERERRGPVRMALVRERLVELFRACFGFARVTLFSDHPALADTRVRQPAQSALLEKA
jgi:lipoyl(octanoyl) transferase